MLAAGLTAVAQIDRQTHAAQFDCHALDLAGVHRPADTYTVFVHATEPGRRGE